MRSTFLRLRRPSLPWRGTGFLASLPLLLVIAALPSAALAQDEEPPRIVATTEMLGWLTRELASPDTEVLVLMSGVDPHAYEPSARDIENLSRAELVVANGLGLEEGMHEILEQIEADGTPLFEAGAHVTVRGDGFEDHGDDGQEHQADDGHDHGSGDPHFWLDPLAMRDVARALGTELESMDLAATGAPDRVATTLEALDAEARQMLAVVPEDARRLVSGHESMGYFADRYDLELVGVVVPGLSSQGEISAGGLAALMETIRATGATTIFTDPATPEALIRAIVEETGATAVALPTEQLPSDGSYLTFIREMATSVAASLAP